TAMVPSKSHRMFHWVTRGIPEAACRKVVPILALQTFERLTFAIIPDRCTTGVRSYSVFPHSEIHLGHQSRHPWPRAPWPDFSQQPLWTRLRKADEHALPDPQRRLALLRGRQLQRAIDVVGERAFQRIL